VVSGFHTRAASDPEAQEDPEGSPAALNLQSRPGSQTVKVVDKLSRLG
jgi:hypothetical protein